MPLTRCEISRDETVFRGERKQQPLDDFQTLSNPWDGWDTTPRAAQIGQELIRVKRDLASVDSLCPPALGANRTPLYITIQFSG